ncbi:hypothetical protein D3C87_970260 [compost metagenome]
MYKLAHLVCLAAFAGANTAVIIEEARKPAPLRSHAKLGVGITAVALGFTSIIQIIRHK